MGAVGGGRRSAVVPTADVPHAPTMPMCTSCHIRFLDVTVTSPSFRSEKRLPALKGTDSAPRLSPPAWTDKRETAACWGGCRPLFQRGYRLTRGGGSQPVLNGARATGAGAIVIAARMNAFRVPARDAYACGQLTSIPSRALFSFAVSACNSGDRQHAKAWRYLHPNDADEAHRAGRSRRPPRLSSGPARHGAG
jgi:hypothetical protein